MTKSRCQRCGFTKESDYDNEKCEKCSGYTRHLPVWINDTFI